MAEKVERFWKLKKHDMGQDRAMIFVLFWQTFLFFICTYEQNVIITIIFEFVQVACI